MFVVSREALDCSRLLELDFPSVSLALIAISRGFEKVYSAVVSLHLQPHVITKVLRHQRLVANTDVGVKWREITATQ
jgi:hypothetical protein